MALDFTASEIGAMKHYLFTGNFKEVLRIANISWDLQNLRNPTLEEVYLADAIFCEEVAELELFLLNSKSSDFCRQVIEYLSSLAIRSTILLMKVEHKITNKSFEPVVFSNCDFDLLTKDITNEPRY